MVTPAIFHRALTNGMKETLISPTIPTEYRDLFRKRAFANLGTVRPNGSGRATPVWCDFEGEFVILNHE